ncbi:MAG: acyl-CoA dehydrogenase family protein, partial [Pseudomonadales bacterium]
EFLTQHLDDHLKQAARLTTGVYTEIEAGKRWYKILSRKGWVAPTWPEEFGGTGWNALERHIFGIECFRAGAPLLFNMGIRHIGPILMAEGTREQRDYFLPRILSGQDIWCQGYSEPSAGSDLASLKLKAERVDDDYLLNGSKIWTTGAHFATHMFCLVRTSSEGRKQQGITFLLLSMDTPGLAVKPIISISGDHEFNEVFFENVRVPVENRVGAEGEGWRVAKALMQFARSNNVNTGWVREALAHLKRTAQVERDGKGRSLCEDESFARQLADTEIFLDTVEVMELRVLSSTRQGESPGAISSMLKTLGSQVKQRVTELAAEAVAYYGFPFQPEALNPCAAGPIIGPAHAITAIPAYLNERAATIYSGASEVQRDVLAKRVLGL